jgi:DNA-binding NtrC family response regulator
VKQGKVLIVDDEKEFAAALAERLRIRSYDALAVFDAEEAIQAVLRDAPAVMVLDVRMPGISGVDVLRAVKQIAPRTVVIILSGHGSVDSFRKDLGNAFFDFALKPVDIDDLRQKIDKALQAYEAA